MSVRVNLGYKYPLYFGCCMLGLPQNCRSKGSVGAAA